MAFLTAFIREGWPPKSKFTADDVPDLTGKVAIVTGANSGIGKETAKVLLQRNATVYFACRDKDRANQAISDLHTSTGNTGTLLELDLASFKSVKSAVDEFLSKEQRLDILVNNAMLMWTPLEETTEEGYDKQFGIGVIGHFYLTKLLLPTLISSGTSDSPSRIVHLSSIGHLMTSRLQFEAFKDGPYRRKNVTTEEMYSQAKLATVLVSNELARRYGDQGVVSMSLNPGNLKTNLVRSAGPIQRAILRKIQHPVHMGAWTSLYAATSPEAAKLNGKYLIPWARVGEPSAAAQDQKTAEKLWDWLEEELKAHPA